MKPAAMARGRGSVGVGVVADIEENAANGGPVQGGQSWRDVLPIHPAADLFPMMSPDELKALTEDIARGMQSPVILIEVAESPVKVKAGRGQLKPVALLDGRNRLDAMEAIIGKSGKVFYFDEPLKMAAGGDIYLPTWD